MTAIKVLTTLGVCIILCFIIVHHLHDINGAVTMSPIPRATVCHIGDPLEVTCRGTVNESVLDWEFAFTGTNDRIVRTVTSTQQIQDIVPSHSTVFIFSRTSELGTLPLVSTLEIDFVGLPLNGSTITCMTDSPRAVATTTLHIVGENDAYHPNPPEVSLEEQFGVDSVTVFLQWTEEFNNSLVTYHVIVEPMAHVNTGNGRANVTLLYNTPYNVSIVADFCGRRNATTTLMTNYVNCGAPLDEPANSVMVMGYNDLALEGDSVSFTCSSGLVLSGPNSSTCKGNGEWEPDPREVACHKLFNYNSHQPLSETGKIAVASVSVFLVTFALAFTAGYVTGHYRRKKSSEPAKKNTSPLYDTIQSEHSKQDVAMNENVAYSTMQPIAI